MKRQVLKRYFTEAELLRELNWYKHELRNNIPEDQAVEVWNVITHRIRDLFALRAQIQEEHPEQFPVGYKRR